jgi:hypothetical protein
MKPIEAMPKNVTFPSGDVVLFDKIDTETGGFKAIFQPIAGRAWTFISSVKLPMCKSTLF